MECTRGLFEMNYFLWIFGWVIAVICSISKVRLTVRGKVSPIVNIVLWMIPVSMAFLLLTSNRVGFDIINYVSRYRYIHTVSAREPVYAWLSQFFYANGFTYYEFRAILTFVSGFFAIWAIYKLEINLFDYLVFYFPLFLFVDSMQVRNQVTIYLFTWAVYWLVKNNDIKGKVVFIVSVIFIAQIHVMFYFYLLLLVFDKTSRNKILRAIMIASWAMVGITWFNGNRVPFINQILNFLLSEGDLRISRYNTTGRFGFLFPALLLCIMTISLSYSSKFIAANDIVISENQRKFILISDTINKISFLLIPFTMMNINYYRFMRNAFVFYIFSAIILIRSSSNKRKAMSILIVAVFVVFALWYWFDIIYYNNNNGISIMDTILKYGEMFWK